MRGRLIAVVGASGAGKDTVIAYARERLEGGVLFVRRSITRSADPHEDHEPLSREAFTRREAAGGFCATWDAHGLRYGIPAEAAVHVGNGGTAVLNGSRRALSMLHGVFARVRVVEVEASEAIRAVRLAARAREEDALIRRRLGRATMDYPGRGSAIRIVNEGEPARAGEAFLRIVQDHQP